MMASPAAFDVLCEQLREPLQRYVVRLAALAGQHLLGVTLYGPAAGGAMGPAASVLVFDQIDLEQLRRLAGEGTRFGSDGIEAPLVMTPQYIHDSCDTFPLELLHVQQRHLTLWGDDHFSLLVFAPADVRLQCERELKVVQLQLHRALLASAGHEHTLGRWERHFGDRLLNVLRGLLWLTGDREAHDRFELVERGERLVGRSLRGIVRALDDSDTAAWHKFSELYRDIQALSSYADGAC